MTTPSALAPPPAPVVVRPNFSKPLPVQTRSYVAICSIWPEELRMRMRNFHQKQFVMPAAPRGSYSLLYIHDDGEYSNRPRPDSPEDDWIFLPKPAHVIATALVELWAKNMLGKPSGFYPGIGAVLGADLDYLDSHSDLPPAFLANLRSGQSALFDWYITDGNGKHIRGDHTEITDIHRMAAREMLDKGAARLPWYHTTEFAAVKTCDACGDQINASAKVCPSCKENLIDWYLKYDLDASGDPVIASAIARIKLSREPKQANPDWHKDKNPRPAQP